MNCTAFQLWCKAPSVHIQITELWRKQPESHTKWPYIIDSSAHDDDEPSTNHELKSEKNDKNCLKNDKTVNSKKKKRITILRSSIIFPRRKHSIASTLTLHNGAAIRTALVEQTAANHNSRTRWALQSGPQVAVKTLLAMAASSIDGFIIAFADQKFSEIWIRSDK